MFYDLKANYNEIALEHDVYMKEFMDLINEMALEADGAGGTPSATSTNNSPPAANNPPAANTPPSKPAPAKPASTNNPKPTTSTNNDGNNTGDNNTNNNPKKKKDDMMGVKVLLSKISVVLQNVIRGVSNRTRAFSKTDDQFKKEYMQRKRTNNPKNNILVESYAYKSGLIDTTFDKVLNDTIKAMTALQEVDLENARSLDGRTKAIISGKGQDILIELFKPYSRNVQIKNAKTFIHDFLLNVRGEKKNLKYTTSNLGEIERIALNSISAINQKMKMHEEKSKRIEATLRQIEFKLTRMQDKDGVIRIKENMQKASILATTYSTLLQSYQELKLEEVLNYRAILRKFYGF